MQAPHILIVDDEPNIRFILERALQHEGYTLDIAPGGAEALTKITHADPVYDLLVLDLQMEPVDGLQVLHTAREQDPDVIVIILTAHGSMESAVEALRLGAFDYMLKPATPETIRQRVREGLQQRRHALHRKNLLGQIDSLRHALNSLDSNQELISPPPLSSRFVRSGELVIDRHHRQVTMADKLLDLTTTEFDLLLCMVVASPKPLSPRQLVNRGLGYDCEDQEARDIIKWHIHHLRRKIEPEPSTPQYIKTVRHQGYLWLSGEQ